MFERLIVDGREVVQIPIEDYNSMMESFLTEKKRKDDFYRKRIEMAMQELAEGHPSLTMDDIRTSCRKYADELERQKGDVAI